MNRLIAVRYRQIIGKACLPTVLLIEIDGKQTELVLKTETDELDWCHGRLPVGYRPVVSAQNLCGVLPHHIVWKEVEREADYLNRPLELVKKVGKHRFYADQVPLAYTGLQTGDQVLLVLGGAGDNLAAGIFRRLQISGGELYRIPAFRLGLGKQKMVDPAILLQVFKENPEKFYRVREGDLLMIKLRNAYYARQTALADRLACSARLSRSLTGQAVRNELGPEFDGDIKAFVAREKAVNFRLNDFIKEEADKEKVLAQVLEQLPVYRILFKPIVGMGPAIAAGLMTAIGDIRNFRRADNLVSFCGMAVNADGEFPCHKKGIVANWQPEARHALYLFGQSMNHFPNSFHGQVLIAQKKKLHKKYKAKWGDGYKKKLYARSYS